MDVHGAIPFWGNQPKKNELFSRIFYQGIICKILFDTIPSKKLRGKYPGT
jgi:hypothetical protein